MRNEVRHKAKRKENSPPSLNLDGLWSLQLAILVLRLLDVLRVGIVPPITPQNPTGNIRPNLGRHVLLLNLAILLQALIVHRHQIPALTAGDVGNERLIEACRIAERCEPPRRSTLNLVNVIGGSITTNNWSSRHSTGGRHDGHNNKLVHTLIRHFFSLFEVFQCAKVWEIQTYSIPIIYQKKYLSIHIGNV